MNNTSITTRSVLLELVEAAIRAPSSHNTQPWLFSIHDEQLDVIADRSRALPVNDPMNRELTISCGAALFNIRVAAASKGLRTAVSLRPDGEDADLLARVSVAPGAHNELFARLGPAVNARRSTRGAMESTEIPDELRHQLALAASCEGATLWSVEEHERPQIAALVAEGDRLQFEDPRWRRELSSWMHARRKGDGLPTSNAAAPFARFVVRHVDLGKRVGSADQELVIQAPLVAVLSTKSDDTGDWLVAGQALERVLLVAAANQVQAGYLNQPCQLQQLRGRLAALATPGEFPQVVLRLGKATASSYRSSRRPVEAVLLRGERAPSARTDRLGDRC